MISRLNLCACLLLAALLCTAASAQTQNADETRKAMRRTLPQVELEDTRLEDAVDFLRDVTGANIVVQWRAIELQGVTRDETITLRLDNVPARKVLQLMLEQVGDGQIVFYVEDNILTITTKDVADRKMVTRVYPVDDLLLVVPDFVAPQINAGGGGGRGGGGGGGGLGGGSGGGRGGGGGGGFGSGAGGGGQGGGLGGGAGGGGRGGAGGGGNEGDVGTEQERADALVELIREVVRPEIWREAGGPASIRYFRGSLVVTAPRDVHEALGG